MSRANRSKVSSKMKRSESPTDFWVLIPSFEALTSDETAMVETGDWPVRRADSLPEHEALVDFLIERSVETWTRSRG